MRPIDRLLVRAELTQTWLDRARTETLQLATTYAGIYPGGYVADAALRARLSDAVNALAEAIWQNKPLRAALMRVSSGKCWYCEANVAERGDNAVDHFRPKNRVAEDGTHPGYWWLACDWENYRFACTWCNSARISTDSKGGKQDHFRLWDESKRAKSPGDTLLAEQPLMLDPLQPDDVQYLTFDHDGTAAPAWSREDDEFLHEWARESIERYHLNRKWIKDKRRDLLLEVEQELKKADEWYRLKAGNPTAHNAWRDSLARLRSRLKRSAEFSGAARAFVGSQRGVSNTAKVLIDTAEW